MQFFDRLVIACFTVAGIGATFAPTIWRVAEPRVAVWASVVSSSEGWPVAKDPWGQPFLHLPAPPGADTNARVGGVFLVGAYSAGPNRLDEHGLGDDIVLRPSSAPPGNRKHREWVEPILYMWLRPICLFVWVASGGSYWLLRTVPPMTRLREALLCGPLIGVLSGAALVGFFVTSVIVYEHGRLLEDSPWRVASRPTVVSGSIVFACGVLVVGVRLWRRALIESASTQSTRSEHSPTPP